MELSDQMRFFSTRILALEEHAIIGASIQIPSSNPIDNAIPEFTQASIQIPRLTTPITSENPDPTNSQRNLTFSELIGDFLPSERTIIDLELNAMQLITREERIKRNPSDKSKLFF
jgi:hypothetical protein